MCRKDIHDVLSKIPYQDKLQKNVFELYKHVGDIGILQSELKKLEKEDGAYQILWTNIYREEAGQDEKI
jgi:hypothetical protein